MTASLLGIGKLRPWTFLQDIQKQTWRFYALVQSCENWVFYVRFVVLVCGKISELNVFSFYNYYKSNLKKLSTPWNLTEASEFGIFKNILFFFNTAYFFLYDIIKKIWCKIVMQNFARFTLSARAHLFFL